MNRRDFLTRLGFGTIGAAAAALTFDVEKLLWVAGEKTIFIPPAPVLSSNTALAAGDVFTIDGVFAVNPITMRPTTLLQRFVITDNVSSGVVNLLKVWPQPLTDVPRGSKTTPLWANPKWHHVARKAS